MGAESQAKSVDSSLDSAIQDNYKAALKAHKNLDDQSISYDANKEWNAGVEGQRQEPGAEEGSHHPCQECPQRHRKW